MPWMRRDRSRIDSAAMALRTTSWSRLMDRVEVIVPELPDVEHFKHVLDENGLDRTIKSVAVKDVRILGELPAVAFTAHLCGRRLVAVRRHGKHCWQSSMLAAG